MAPGRVGYLVKSRAAWPLIVRTESGPVRGVTTPRGQAFLDIPFAAPPVGPLRFAPPAPAAGWRTVRDATRAGILANRRPVAYLVFDVLELYGVNLTRRSFDERRATLERLDLPAPTQLSPLYPDLDDLWAVTCEHGLEGVVAKRRASTYQPGRRSTDWVEATHRSTRTALVGGWLPVVGSRTSPGSLMLGAPDRNGRLRWLGRVGSGLAGSSGTIVAGRLGSLAQSTSPFEEALPAADTVGVRWCQPIVLVDIVYKTRTRAGRLRQPVLRGVRDDVPADAWEVP